MNAAYSATDSTRNQLRSVLEPLASYICAADRPKSTLRSVLSALVREVEATNGAAALHFRSLRTSN